MNSILPPLAIAALLSIDSPRTRRKLVADVAAFREQGRQLAALSTAREAVIREAEHERRIRAEAAAMLAPVAMIRPTIFSTPARSFC